MVALSQELQYVRICQNQPFYFISGSSPPVGFMVMVLNSTSVELSWQYPESPNGEIRGYYILESSLVILNITLNTVDDGSNQTVVVSGLTPFTIYRYRVRAFSFGDQNDRPDFVHIGIATDEIIVRTDEDGKMCDSVFIVLFINAQMVQYSAWSSYKLHSS